MRGMLRWSKSRSLRRRRKEGKALQCLHCQAYLPEGATRCSACGAAISQAPPSRVLVSLSQVDDTQTKPSGFPIWLVAVLTVAVLVVGAIGGYVLLGEKAQTQEVTFSLESEAAPSTLDAVFHVTGADASGNVIDKYCLVNVGNPSLSLVEGTYQISLLGPSIDSDGLVYSTSGGPLCLQVDASGATVTAAASFTLSAVDPTTYTQSLWEQVSANYRLCDQAAGVVDGYIATSKAKYGN